MKADDRHVYHDLALKPLLVHPKATITVNIKSTRPAILTRMHNDKPGISRIF
jgi:hypothetical protein